MLCKKCNEPLIGQVCSPMVGVCYDCYAIYDMERFLEPGSANSDIGRKEWLAREATRSDTPQEDQEDTGSDFDTFDFELGKYVPLGHTKSSNPDLRPALRGDLGNWAKTLARFRVAEDKWRRELKRQQFQSSVDKADK